MGRKDCLQGVLGVLPLLVGCKMAAAFILVFLGRLQGYPPTHVVYICKSHSCNAFSLWMCVGSSLRWCYLHSNLHDSRATAAAGPSSLTDRHTTVFAPSPRPCATTSTSTSTSTNPIRTPLDDQVQATVCTHMLSRVATCPPNDPPPPL
ncbi:hypothetical protein T440DRAFT_310593 [Plenodomus tracheiphilus IPT5]|uniref:Uncharacterized protein n=1 Tax=Plenodomus tracheiphilus IPT5 TaxID=1408161 RepID=A0A6A7BDW6_9PLEO|nr:hypothetical protein T440DRAFT_310593 [Plenodomus tracheiphilus IPT5]